MNYAEESASVSGSAAGTYGLCCASGCQLPGAMSTSTSGSQQWYCRVHFGAPISDHNDITARINNRVILYRIAGWLSNRAPTGAVTEKTKERIRALGRKELLNPVKPGAGISSYGLASHIFAVMDAECRTPQAHMGTPAPKNATAQIEEPEFAE